MRGSFCGLRHAVGARLFTQFAHQFQFGLEIDVVGQFDVLKEPCRLNVVRMIKHKFRVLRGGAFVFLACATRRAFAAAGIAV